MSQKLFKGTKRSFLTLSICCVDKNMGDLCVSYREREVEKIIFSDHVAACRRQYTNKLQSWDDRGEIMTI